jgi:ribonuclease R
MDQKNKILALMREKTHRPLLMKELMRSIGAPKEDRQDVKHAIRELIREGEIIKIRGNRYGLPSKMNLVVGKLSVHPDGYGFVMPDAEDGRATGRGEDVYVRAIEMMGAMHGDRVVARVEREKGEGKREGRVIRILERATDRVVGKYESGRGFGVVVSTNPRITHDFYIPPKERGGAKDGQMVVAEIKRYPEPHRSPEAEVVKILGLPGEPGIETDVVIEQHGLSTKFSGAAMDEAKASPQNVTPAMRKGRVDLRTKPTVTIDGERARDFDDAVSVEPAGEGLIRLFVSIADVANYVKPGSALDGDAKDRATSVYFPDRVLPMLPEELSNGICSLNPDVERLTLTAEMVFDKDGNRVSYDVYESVIKSSARMTYTDVALIIEQDDPETKEKYAALADGFMLMRELMERLNKMRRKRGSIDFDLPEPEVILDLTGKTTAIVKAERNQAHKLIEEFMLAANETVASHLESHGVPFLYRVHEEPDEEKMEVLGALVKGFGLPWPAGGNIRPKHLANLLGKLAGLPEERFLNTVILRSMKLAKYTPENVGHFGLAARCYCHFTSPIRRYPDLSVHRALKELIKKKSISAERKTEMASGLGSLGQHCSFMERESEEAEREVVEIKKLQFMTDKVGGEFAGYITGVTAFGFFVELEEYFVEGLVRLTSLHADYYTYLEQEHALTGEHTGRTYRLGDKVDIILERIDLERRQMEFSVAGMSESRRPTREPVWMKYRAKGKRR